MGLLSAPPSFAHCTTNMPATPNTGGPGGTDLTFGAAGADSAVSSVFTLTHDCEYLVIFCDGLAVAGANNASSFDVMIDPAGGTTWTTLIPSLLCGTVNEAGSGSTGGVYYHFPIYIKSGSAVGVKGRRADVARAARILLMAYGGNQYPGSWWCGDTVTAVGLSDAFTGTSHTAGSTSTYSSWASLGSALTSPAGAIQFYAQGTNTTFNDLQYFFEVGAGSTIIGHPHFKRLNTSESSAISHQSLTFCDLPIGTQLQVRGMCLGTAQAVDVAAWVVS